MSRKKRRRRNQAIIILVLSLLLISGLIYELYNSLFSNKLMLKGEWYRNMDMNAYVEDAIEDYLKTAALGEEIEIEQYLDGLQIRTNLIISKDGIMEETIDEESYEICKANAYNALAAAVDELVKKRMDMVNVTTSKDLSTLSMQATGMNTTEYLKEYGPKLLPGLDELKESMEYTRSYESDSHIIKIDVTDDGETTQKECEYLISHGTLVIDYGDESFVYHKK